MNKGNWIKYKYEGGDVEIGKIVDVIKDGYIVNDYGLHVVYKRQVISRVYFWQFWENYALFLILLGLGIAIYTGI